MPDLPIACTLSPGELNTRTGELLPGVASGSTRLVAIENGYRFEFVPSSESLNAIVIMVDAERRCCRFLRFQLTVEPDEGPIRLDITGPAGTQEFLASLLTSA